MLHTWPVVFVYVSCLCTTYVHKIRAQDHAEQSPLRPILYLRCNKASFNHTCSNTTTLLNASTNLGSLSPPPSYFSPKNMALNCPSCGTYLSIVLAEDAGRLPDPTLAPLDSDSPIAPPDSANTPRRNASRKKRIPHRPINPREPKPTEEPNGNEPKPTKEPRREEVRPQEPKPNPPTTWADVHRFKTIMWGSLTGARKPKNATFRPVMSMEVGPCAPSDSRSLRVLESTALLMMETLRLARGERSADTLLESRRGCRGPCPAGWSWSSRSSAPLPTTCTGRGRRVAGGGTSEL